jgi:hypothetical protein
MNAKAYFLSHLTPQKDKFLIYQIYEKFNINMNPAFYLFLFRSPLSGRLQIHG